MSYVAYIGCKWIRQSEYSSDLSIWQNFMVSNQTKLFFDFRLITRLSVFVSNQCVNVKVKTTKICLCCRMNRRSLVYSSQIEAVQLQMNVSYHNVWTRQAITSVCRRDDQDVPSKTASLPSIKVHQLSEKHGATEHYVSYSEDKHVSKPLTIHRRMCHTSLGSNLILK